MWFSGVALPFPKCRQADMARSEGSIISNHVFGMRFHTPSADYGQLNGAMLGLSALGDDHVRLDLSVDRSRAESLSDRSGGR